MQVMTKEQRGILSDKLVKWVPATVTPIGVVWIVWLLATYKTELDLRIQNSSRGALTEHEKVKVLNHVNAAPNEVDTYKAFLKQDSLMKAYSLDRKKDVEQQAKRDTLIKKNSITIYQLKQAQEEQVKVSKEILSKINQSTN